MKSICPVCNQPFTPVVANQRYHSPQCRQRAYRQRSWAQHQQNRPPVTPLNRPSTYVASSKVPTAEDEQVWFAQLSDDPLGCKPFQVPRPSSLNITVPAGIYYGPEYDDETREWSYIIEWDKGLLSEFRSNPTTTLEQLIVDGNYQSSHPKILTEEQRQHREAQKAVIAAGPKFSAKAVLTGLTPPAIARTIGDPTDALTEAILAETKRLGQSPSPEWIFEQTKKYDANVH